ncbi:hypothetical protein BDW02DRAFT_603576 [Decorospora gaudefroyi]|uniref:Uncharacterized protein n=1 Tax=Decorospora gaudefroyi TaxID=184978 RepID=A0A6A5K1G8_9PLEO|nr:hypothetical protein BDW02DRAFT_603576 [Decorospora gaudefroyi]
MQLTILLTITFATLALSSPARPITARESAYIGDALDADGTPTILEATDQCKSVDVPMVKADMATIRPAGWLD